MKTEHVRTCRALLYDMRANSAAACIPPNSTAINPQPQVKTDCVHNLQESTPSDHFILNFISLNIYLKVHGSKMMTD